MPIERIQETTEDVWDPADGFQGLRRVLWERNHMQRHAILRLPRGLSAPTVWLGAFGLSCLSLACARTVDERLAAVSELLTEARGLAAAEYAPEALSAAEELLAKTRAELELQDARPWPLGSQRRARRLLEESEVAASRVRAETIAAIVRARQDAVRAMALANDAFDRASEAYWRSPRGPDTQLELLRMRRDLDQLRSTLTEAELALENGRYPAVARLAGRIESEALAVARDIERSTAYQLASVD